MNKILSWKIDSSTYAYIYPIKNSYISNRIPENSPLWANIIGEISTWTLDTYKSNFNKMSAEVKSKFGIAIPWKDEYWDLGIDGSINGVNIVLLSGKDGDGEYSGDVEIGPEVYEEFNKMIDAELQKAREAIEKKNAEVKAFVEAKVTETISAAKQTIAETKAEIDETRNELEGKLEGATEALDKAAALFDMGEGGITGEKIQEALSSVTECGKWIAEYSGTVSDFKTDYDAAKRILGGVGSAEDALAGLFSQIGTTINDMDNTVGNVERWMVASAATIGDIATWYDVNASAVTEASSIINASAGTITDTINFISGDGLTTKVTSIMDGRNATLRDEIKLETASGLTNVRNEMNALSGSILQELTHYAPDSAITSIGNRMDVLNTTMSEWMTKTDSAMSMTHDLREEWSIESGKLSTVSNLVAKTDANGEIEYWISGATGEEIRVSRTENGSWVDNSGNFYGDNRVYVHYSDTLGSYIQQEVSAISMSVMGKDNVTAAIQLAVKEDAESGGEAIINMVANKVVIDADMIARSIIAKTANIGGIMMGDGYIKSMSEIDGKPSFFINGRTGSIYGQNVEVTGKINALEGTIGAVQIDNKKLTINDSLGEDDGDDKYTGIVSFLNAGDEYSNKSYGKLVFASGFSDKKEKLYQYVSMDNSADYKEIYLTEKYTHENKIEEEVPLLVFEKRDNEFIEINDTSFYFYYKEITSAETGDFVISKENTYQESSGETIVSSTTHTYFEEYIYTLDESDTKIRYKFAKEFNGLTQKINTKIYANGLIETKFLNAKNGDFSGSINADGVFKGELKNATGTLKHVSIYDSILSGTFRIGKNDELKGTNSNNTEYFYVSDKELSKDTGDKQENIKGFSWSRQNANGNDNGQIYMPEQKLSTIYFKSGDTITIPSMYGSFYRYAPTRRTNNVSTVNISIIHYEEEKLMREKIYTFTFSAIRDTSETSYFTTNEYEFKAAHDGYVVISINAKIHLSTYYWLGFDKAYGSLSFNSNAVKAKIQRPTPTYGTKIGNNGFSVITNGNRGGATVHVLDDSVNIYQGNHKNGIRIEHDGFYIRFNEKEYKLQESGNNLIIVKN